MLSPQEIDLIILSLKIAFKSIFIALPLALFFGYILARVNFFGKVILNAFLHISLVLPPVVVGFLLLLAFGKQGIFGGLLEKYGIQLVFTSNGAALAAAVMAFPSMLRVCRQAIENVDTKIEAMARSLGANYWNCLFTITLPNAMNGIIAAAIIGFAASMGEFGAVITFAANIPGQTQTLALAIYTALQLPNGEEIALRLSIFSVIVAVLALIFSEILIGLEKKQRQQND